MGTYGSLPSLFPSDPPFFPSDFPLFRLPSQLSSRLLFVSSWIVSQVSSLSDEKSLIKFVQLSLLCNVHKFFSEKLAKVDQVSQVIFANEEE